MEHKLVVAPAACPSRGLKLRQCEVFKYCGYGNVAPAACPSRGLKPIEAGNADLATPVGVAPAACPSRGLKLHDPRIGLLARKLRRTGGLPLTGIETLTL